jgi:hypothetical protein
MPLSGIEPATSLLVSEYLNQLHYTVPQISKLINNLIELN